MSVRYEPEVMPRETEALSPALERENARIASSIASVWDLDTSRQVGKPRDGMLRWFDATVYDPGQGTGLYVYTNGKWQRLALFSGTTTFFAFKTFTFAWDPGPGLVTDATYNVFSVTDQGAGTYRVTINQNTAYGLDLLARTLPTFHAYTPSRTGEGFIIVDARTSGTDGNNRHYFDTHLTEAYIMGTSLRARDYTLVAGDLLYGYGYGNLVSPNAEPLPP